MNGSRKFKLTFLMTLLISVLLLAACGSSTSSNASDSDGGDKEADNGETYTLKLASVVGDWSNLYGDMEGFKKEVEENSDNRIEVQLFPDAQLGAEREILESLQNGNLELGSVSTIPYGAFDERVSIFDLPYLIDSYEEMGELLDGPVGDAVKEIMIENNTRPLAWGFGEFRWINSREKPIYEPSDLKNIKFRTPESKTLIEYYNLMESATITMSNAEVYTALQQGVADVYDNGAELVLLQKFYENTKYSTATNHVFYPWTINVNEQIWQSLPEDLQDVLETAAKNAMEEQRKDMAASVEENSKILTEEGIEIIELSDEELQLWKDAAQPILDDAEELIGPELLKILRQEVDVDL